MLKFWIKEDQGNLIVGKNVINVVIDCNLNTVLVIHSYPNTLLRAVVLLDILSFSCDIKLRC